MLNSKAPLNRNCNTTFLLAKLFWYWSKAVLAFTILPKELMCCLWDGNLSYQEKSPQNHLTFHVLLFWFRYIFFWKSKAHRVSSVGRIFQMKNIKGMWPPDPNHDLKHIRGIWNLDITKDSHSFVACPVITLTFASYLPSVYEKHIN